MHVFWIFQNLSWDFFPNFRIFGQLPVVFSLQTRPVASPPGAGGGGPLAAAAAALVARGIAGGMRIFSLPTWVWVKIKDNWDHRC